MIKLCSSVVLALLFMGLSGIEAACAVSLSTWDTRVVKVEVMRTDGLREVGSAVPLADGRLVTNCHVLRDAQKIEISNRSGKWRAAMSSGDAYRDLCFLDAPDFKTEPAAIADVLALRVGMRAVAVGYTGGQFAVSKGRVKALHLCPCDGGRIIQTSASFDRGSSGGGLFDPQGRLMGILTFKSQAGGDFHFAIPAGWLRNLARQDFQPLAGGKTFWETGGKDSPYFLAACALGAKKDWRPLSDLATDWSRKEPDNPEAWMALGRARIGMEHLEGAAEAFRRTLLLDSTHAEAGWELQKLEFEIGRPLLSPN